MKTNRVRSRRGPLLVVGVILGLSALVGTNVTSALEAPVNLGTTESFAILAGSGVTNTGPTGVSGNLGSCPTPAITGFPPGTVRNGTIHAADAQCTQAQSDLTIAYNDAAGRAPTTTYPGVKDLGGLTLTPGVYKADAFAITGTLTLDAQGDPNAVWIFQAGSTLITATNSRVALINSGQPCNVFWQVGSSATLGVGSTFIGTILALTSITANTDAIVQGRLLARNGAVTLDSNTVTRPVCAPAPTSTSSTTSAPTTTSSTTVPPTTTAPPTTTSSTILPPVTVPPVTLPPVTLPPVTLPPDITVPPVTVPPVTLPPDITVPPVTVPPVTLPDITVPPVTVPRVTLPPVTVPPVTLPPVTLPPVTLPPVTLPDTTLPSTTTSTSTTLPDAPTTTSSTVAPPVTTTTTVGDTDLVVDGGASTTTSSSTTTTTAAATATTTTTISPTAASTTDAASTTTTPSAGGGVTAGTAAGVAGTAGAGTLVRTGSSLHGAQFWAFAALASGGLMVLVARERTPARRRRG